MIEPTDEMRGQAYHAARQFAIEHRHGLPDDRMLDDVIAAVLALVERDYCVERKGHVYHPLSRSRPGRAVIEVVVWDWRDQPDQQSLAAAISRVSGGRVHAVWPETGDDQYALVLSDRPLTAEQAAAVYRNPPQ